MLALLICEQQKHFTLGMHLVHATVVLHCLLSLHDNVLLPLYDNGCMEIKLTNYYCHCTA